MPAPMATGPFPTSLNGKSVRFCCRFQSYDAIVAKAERDEDASFASVLLQLPCKPPKRPFAVGERASLETLEGSWAGTVVKSKEIGDASLYTLVPVSVPDGGDCSGYPDDGLLTIYPSKSQQNQLSFSMNKPSNDMKLKVGLIGFGALGMHLVEALLDKEDIDLVALIIDSPISDMRRAWKNSAINLRIKDHKTIVFKRQNMEIDEEVMVRVVHDRVSWDEVSVDYVVDSLNILTGDKHVIYSMAYEGEDKEKAYSLVYDDKGIDNQIPKVTAEMKVKFKYMKLIVSSADAFESVVSNVAEWVSNVAEWDWEGASARICFLADDNPTERICNPFTEQSDINFLLERSAQRVGGGTDAISSVDAGDRVSFLLRIFVDLIRRVPISGCLLEL